MSVVMSIAMKTVTLLISPTQGLATSSPSILVSSAMQRVAKPAHSGVTIAIASVIIGFFSLMVSNVSMAENNEHFSGDPFAQVSNNGSSATTQSQTIPSAVTSKAPPITADDLIVQTSFMLMTSPQETMQSLKRLGQNADIKSLLNNPANQRVLSRGNPAEIAQLPEYKQLQKNPDIQKLLSQYETDDPRLAALLATFWQRSQNLQSSPEFQAVMLDPVIQSQLQEGNPLPLLTHPKGLELLRSLLNPTSGTAP